ncbi:mannosyl-oligosaccharide alpha-1,2-mannosidase [Herbihabitans rhizosphaerae]|uniref:Mannosyl-oligosaccharide alpha-1,2-mannosidase n=1 Tax=Herbihabitans rhizosphaerae TaxID=1872711 RepID=A0A4Q7KFF4_9PSEU|nr:glycoside hydrolase family 47 protein [Herbihabitans rhizosphaerae]RZS32690.1 mannosyl-oligosaccharide alpha-1,2-mannosidase [Herbihabitans rhizosphaerae]
MRADLSRRGFIGLLGAAGLTGVAAPNALAQPLAEPGHGHWRRLANEVRNETKWAWKQYVAKAFGHDQIKPVSGGYEEFFVPGHPVGLTVVEALDTLWLMELDAEFEQGLAWVNKHLSFDIDAPFQVFETNIRMLGGLLSAYHCVPDPRLLELANDLGTRLLPAFTKSPSGVPYRYANLRTGAVSRPETNLAETGTYITEFGTLSKLTGDKRFYDAAKRAFQVTFDKRSPLDLLPFAVHAETGEFTNRTATVGPPADSYYEYLFDGWKLFGDKDLRSWYDTLIAGILEHQAETVGGHMWFKQVDAFTGALVSREQSELASFFSGLLAEGGDVKSGRAYHDSWNVVQDRYGVLPEGIAYDTLAAISKGNQLRPEFADGAFSLWLETGDELYRHRNATHFRHMVRTSKVRYGYTILDDVTTNPVKRGDFCPGYWWSEQLKYYYLIFGNARRFDYRDHYLSTEGNLFKGAIR